MATASYEARRYGIDSGMPLRLAYRKCPEAVFLPVDASAYRAASGNVMATLTRFPGVLETAGWEEAYLEAETEDPEALAGDVQRSVRKRTEFDCSVGIGDNKLRAKIASALAKPAGVFRLTGGNWAEVMNGRSPDALFGVGRKRSRQLEEIGIATVADLARADQRSLAETFGPNIGPWLVRLARGEDDTPVLAEREGAKSRGRETTFQEDLEVRGRGCPGGSAREGCIYSDQWRDLRVLQDSIGFVRNPRTNPQPSRGRAMGPGVA